MTSASYASSFEIPSEGSAAGMLARRCTSIPLVVALAGVALASAPIWIPLAGGVDLLRRPRTALRCGAFLSWYLCCEALGLLASGGIWLGSGAGFGGAAGRQRLLCWSFALQRRWARALFEGAARIFGFRLEVEGADVLARAPLLLFLRHASIADTLLPALLVSCPHGIRLRYVLKRELLWDPCLDVVGRRLPNYFARRDSAESERERRGVAALAHGLGAREGVLIYPEGTRFTRAKRRRVLERLSRGGHRDLHTRAEALRHVLPPRLGGPLALLEASPGVDVVFGTHAGFERAGTFWDLWSGSLVGAVLRVRFWRVSADDIPATREARIAWLYGHWQRVDDFVDDALVMQS